MQGDRQHESFKLSVEQQPRMRHVGQPRLPRDSVTQRGCNVDAGFRKTKACHARNSLMLDDLANTSTERSLHHFRVSAPLRDSYKEGLT